MQGRTVFTFGCDSTSGSLLHLLNIKSMNHQDFEPDPLYHWARILKHWLPSFGHQLAAAVLGVSWQRNVQIEQSNKTLHPKNMMTSVHRLENILTSWASVCELVSVIHVILVASAEDETDTALFTSPAYPRNVRSVDTGLGHLQPQEPGLSDLNSRNGTFVILRLDIAMLCAVMTTWD